MKKQLPLQKKEELPNIENYTPKNIALVTKYFEKTETAPAKFKVDRMIDNKAYISPDEQDDLVLHYAKLFQAFGTVSIDLQQHFINQLISVFKGCSSNADKKKLVYAMNTAVTILNDLKPKDTIETMLLVQMIGVHNIAMTALCNATLIDTQAAREINICYATKMLRTFTQQVEVLKNYRQKGHQKVSVENVNVNDGGQAIVGNVNKNNGE